MPVRRLPEIPNFEHLKYQAKDLMKDHAALEPSAAQRLREFHPRLRNAGDAEIFAAPFKLSDAQLAIAREYGFPSWPRLKRHIEHPTIADRLELPHHERIEDAAFRHAVELMDAGNVAGLRAHLAKHPGLQRRRVVFEGGNYFRNPSLLEFAAENPVRHGKLPSNIVEVVRVILDAGIERVALDETLGLVATGRVPRECGVQIPLIELLCDRGADPQAAAEAAALLEEPQCVVPLLNRGARMTVTLAAALDRAADFDRLLPTVDANECHLAMAVAAQYGRVEIMRRLLDAGEDPNRFNPVGGHSHTTPLHQAAGFGHFDLVRLLVEHGARLDQKDILWGGTPEGWARHGGHNEIADYLREKAKAR
jgi:hypothetical protein